MQRHTLSVLVQDVPGVLSRVSGLIARRAFNIESLTVGLYPRSKALSRMTVVVEAEADALEQVTKQLNKLVNVIKIVELNPEQSSQRDHILVKVRSDASTRASVVQAVELFRANVVDVSTDAVTVEATGSARKLGSAPGSARTLWHSRTSALRHHSQLPAAASP